MQDWITQIIIISYKIGSLKLLLFHTRLDHSNYYYFIQDWITQIIIIPRRLDHTNYYYSKKIRSHK
jgi:hypothetical protein